MSKKKYTLEDIIPFLPKNNLVKNDQYSDKVTISKVTQTSRADSESLAFIDSQRSDKQLLYETTMAGILICDSDIEILPKELAQIIIIVDFPKLIFSIIVNSLFVERPAYGIHSTAHIHPEADIHENTYIGPFSYIGKCIIGEGTIIYGNCYLYDKVKIGKNVIVHAGTVLGADGYGYNRNQNGFPIQFPHVGDIIIEDYVEIGANSAIDMGALSSTRIKYATKIDNLVHIGHNVQIGRNCYVAANTSIAGSTVVGDYSEIWMGVSVADGLRIGARTTIGMGSAVIRNVDDQNSVFGNPARIIAKSKG